MVRCIQTKSRGTNTPCGSISRAPEEAAGRVPREFDNDSLATHPQLRQCAEARHGPIVEFLFDQGQVREPLYQGEDGLLSFDTRQMRSQAQMFVAAKRLVPDVLSANVEAVGLGIRVG